MRWVVVGLIAVAGLALSMTPATYSAPTRSVDVGGNRLGAGVLDLDLGAAVGHDAAADLSFDDLMPGDHSDQRLWLATNAPTSPVAATLAVRLDHLHDVDAASGIEGSLSRRLEFRFGVARASRTSAGCAATAMTSVELPAVGAGNLRLLAGGSGERIELPAADHDGPLVLGPGEGVCVSVSAYWPPSDADDDAQGDRLSVRVAFELTQVQP